MCQHYTYTVLALLRCRLFFARCKISLNFKQQKLGWRPGNEADTVYRGRWTIWEGPLTSLTNMVSTRPVDRQRNQPLASRNDRHPLPSGEAHEHSNAESIALEEYFIKVSRKVMSNRLILANVCTLFLPNGRDSYLVHPSPLSEADEFYAHYTQSLASTPMMANCSLLWLVSDQALIRIAGHGYHGYWVSSSIHC